MKDVIFCLRQNCRTYGLEFRERNYPTFTGKYNVYISVYGQLSGNYLGAIDTPLMLDVSEEIDVNKAINEAEKIIMSGVHNVAIW